MGHLLPGEPDHSEPARHKIRILASVALEARARGMESESIHLHGDPGRAPEEIDLVAADSYVALGWGKARLPNERQQPRFRG